MAIDYGSMYGSANDVQGFGIGNVPITTPPAYTFGGLTSPAPNTTVSYNPPVGPVGDVPLTTRPFPDLQGPKPKPTGGLTFSLGGGGGGGGAPVPSNVLNTRQFPTYESTWTPPAAVTPEPYNYATRDPYIYGDGLSNAGAAYDIWGSKPGENPYVMTTPSDYTPGLLGMQPVTLPDSVPSTNVRAPNVPSGPSDRQKFTGTPEQIIRDYGYYDRTAPMQNNVPPSMRDSAPNAGVMLDAARINFKKGHYPSMQAAMDAQVAFSKKYPAKTPAENAAQIAASQKMLLSQDQRPKKEKKITRISNIPVAGTGASGPPGRGSTKPIAIATTKKIDKLISTKKSTMGSGSNYKMSYNPSTGRGGF